MGSVGRETMSFDEAAGRRWLRQPGRVQLENRHRAAEPLDASALRLVAIGRAFTADLAVAEVAFYR